MSRLARLAAAALLLGAGGCAPATGPAEVPWDRAACARCGMLVSEPAFAAQLRTDQGEVLFFDDPGGLLLWLSEHGGTAREVWFHHLREDRWLPLHAVAFERVEPTPMGYGLGAVDAGAPDGLDLEAARRHALEVEAERTGPAPRRGGPPPAGGDPE